MSEWIRLGLLRGASLFELQGERRPVPRVRLVPLDTPLEVAHTLSAVPDPESPAPSPARRPVPVKPPRATAAHPRAFKGTKWQPPKPPQPEAPEVPTRPRPSDLPALVARGFDPQRLARLAAGGDPYLVYQHGADANARCARWPAGFVRWLLPALAGSGLDLTEVGAWLSLWQTVAWTEVAGPGDGLCAALTWLAFRWPRAGLAMAPLLCAVPPDRRLATARVLVEAELEGLSGPLDAERFVALSAMTPPSASGAPAKPRSPETWDARLRYLLRCARIGAAPFALEVFSLTPGDERWKVPHELPLDPTPRAADVLPVLADAAPDARPRRLLEACGQLPGLAPILRETDWAALAPRDGLDVAWSWIGPFLPWWSPRPYDFEVWPVVRASLPALIARLGQFPERHRLQASTLALLGRGRPAWPLIERLARPPFPPDADLVPLCRGLSRFFAEHPNSEARFLAAPAASFAVLAERVARDADAGLIGRGLPVLLAHLPERTLSAFEQCPRALLALARSLGAARPRHAPHTLGPLAVRLAAVDAAFALPEPLPELIAALDALGLAYNPVPRALRDGRPLTPTQVARHRARIEAGLVRVRIDWMHRSLLSWLGATSDDPAAGHAALMLRNVGQNRRALRRVLQAFAAGDTTVVEQHPETLAFRRRHPRLDDEKWARWLAGVEVETTLEGRPVRLSVEQNPLEILQLGTYVGTCRALGGIYEETAAAEVLDLNKRVVFARDDRGTVRARQVVALTEDEHLVAYPVYPPDTPLAEAFRRWDAQLAEALGWPLHPPGEEPNVQHILSMDAYLDDPWRE